MILSFRH